MEELADAAQHSATKFKTKITFERLVEYVVSFSACSEEISQTQNRNPLSYHKPKLHMFDRAKLKPRPAALFRSSLSSSTEGAPHPIHVISNSHVRRVALPGMRGICHGLKKLSIGMKMILKQSPASSL